MNVLKRNINKVVEDSNNNHEERRKATEEILAHAENFNAYSKDSADEKRNLRQEFDDHEHQLRNLKDQILETELENKNLQMIAETEQSIQDAKDRAEEDAIKTVNDDLRDMVDRLSRDAEADISYQEVSLKIRSEIESNYNQSKAEINDLFGKAGIAKEQLEEDMNEVKERAAARDEDNEDLRGRIEDGEVEVDRLTNSINALNAEIDNIKRDHEEEIARLDKERVENENIIADLHKTAEDLKVQHSKYEVSILKINSQLQYLDEAEKSVGNDLIRKKIDKFDRSIKATNRGTEQLQNYLDGINRDWVGRIESANRELSNLIRETESRSASEKLNKLLKELQAKQNEIEDLKRRRNQLERDLAGADPDSLDREILNMRGELDEVNDKLIQVLHFNNKTEIARLRLEIETSKREHESKGTFFADLLMQIEERKQLLEELQYEISENESFLHEFEETLQRRKDEGEDLDRQLAERDEEVRRLESRLAEMNKIRAQQEVEARYYEEQSRLQEEARLEEEARLQEEARLNRESLLSQRREIHTVEETVYVADKSDEIDVMIAKYINIAQCQVPIKRLGGGYYQFGTRKIYAKILNGKLVIRVGGGYMVIDEFIETYSSAELKKMEQRRNRGLEAVPNLGEMSPSNRSFGSPRKLGSPSNKTMKANKKKEEGNGFSFSTKGSSAMNGTMRNKNFTQAQMDKMIASGAARDFRK